MLLLNCLDLGLWVYLSVGPFGPVRAAETFDSSSSEALRHGVPTVTNAAGVRGVNCGSYGGANASGASYDDADLAAE